MLERHRFILFLAFLSSLHRQVSCCDHITSTELFPSSISLSSSYVEIRCNHDATLTFGSFYIPSGDTLTASRLPKHEIVNRYDYSTLIVNDIELGDIGEYQCNFRDEDGNECTDVITLRLDVEFCTRDHLTYHHYIGENVMLECCVRNQNMHYWRKDDSTEAIAEGEGVEFIGTSLKISSLSLEDKGRYVCVADNGAGEETLTANLKVYERLSITLEPQQKVVNVSERAELACTASGYPRPAIVWTREVSTQLQLQSGVIEKREEEVNSTTVQSTLTFFSVTDEVTGTYHCTGVNGNGSLSAVASLQLFGTPSAPLEVTLAITNQTSINVTWKQPLDDGHLQLLQYSVMWFRMGTNGSILDLRSHQVNGSITNYIITGLLPVTNYSVTIYAINGRGRGMGSDEQNVLTLPSVPGPLPQLDSSQLTSFSANIEFTIPSDTGGSPITHLRISHQPGKDEEDTTTQTFPLPDAIPREKRSQKLEGLEGDTSYTVRVSVGNSIGFGKEEVTLFRTLRPGYPATPTSVRALGEVGATSVRLTWEVVDVGEPGVEYEITAVERGGDVKMFTVKREDVLVDGTTESAEVYPLEPETCYTFTVTISSEEAVGFTSPPSNITCTLSCQQTTCMKSVGGIRDEEDKTGQLVPILVVTIVVAIVVLLAVILVAVLSRKYSRRHKSSDLFSHNQNFVPGTSQFSNGGMDRSISSASSYNRQISQNSSSLADPEDAPTTSSSTVSENPFYFGPSQSQNGFPQYQNQPHPYDNNGMDSVSNLSVESGHQLQVAVTGSKTIGSSFPLFPIPEHTVAMGGHFENSAPAIPVRAHPPRDDTVMTDNPAFEKPPRSLPVTSQHGVPHTPEDSTPPPPVPPPTYRRTSLPDVDRTNQHHPQHIHIHTAQQQSTPQLSYSAHSLPLLGESFSQTSRSPSMPRTEFFLPPDEDEEDEVQFTDNDAYESATPQPPRREAPPDPSSSLSQSRPSYTNLSVASVPLPPDPASSNLSQSRPSYTNLSVASFPRGQSASPVLPRRGSTQSGGSGVNEGPPPRFEISRQQDSGSSRGRGAVFETVTIKSHV